MSAYRWAFLAMILGSPAAFAIDEAQQEKPEQVDPASLKAVQPLVDGNIDFALDVYRALPKEKNIIFSPFGLSEALAICYAGARGETATAMATTLAFPNEGQGVDEEFAILHRVQENLEHSDSIDYDMSNSLWSQAALLPAYTELAERQYGAEFFEVDFRSPETVKAKLDAWVQEKTRGKGTFPEEALENPRVELLIVNTLYLKASWRVRFKAYRTKDRPFHLVDGTEVEVPTMVQTSLFRYGKWYGLEVLEMPYKGGELSAVILLPEKKKPIEGAQGLSTSRPRTTLAELEADMRSSDLRSAIRCTELERVQVYLPRFSIASKHGLKKVLKSMGMNIAFTPEADFTGMTGAPDLRIEDVLQNARIDLDEEGTEAVAVTAVSMGPRGAVQPPQNDPIIFRADRPFMFVLRENRTGTILFMGRMADPRERAE